MIMPEVGMDWLRCVNANVKTEPNAMPTRHVTATSRRVDLILACSNSYAAKQAATMKITHKNNLAPKKARNKKHFDKSTTKKACHRKHEINSTSKTINRLS